MRALLCVMILAACGGMPDEGGLDEADLTVTQANRFFTTQYGPTKWNAAGHPDGFEDCGPTTGLMARGALAVTALLPPARVEDQIIAMRQSMHPGSTTGSPTYTPMFMAGLGLFVAASRIPATLAGVNAALAKGVVAIGGDPRDAWGKALSDAGAYLYRYKDDPADRHGHWVLVAGRSGKKYVVNDPLSVNGAITVSGAQIEQYFADGVAPQWTVAVGIQR